LLSSNPSSITSSSPRLWELVVLPSACKIVLLESAGLVNSSLPARWDTLAYLQIEYRIVWLAKASSLKFAYLYTRYITLLTGILFFIGFFGMIPLVSILVGYSG
jgi:hypothetical protein